MTETVLITGAGIGIGRATAKAFAKIGHHVIVTDVLEKEGNAVVDEIVAAGGTAEFHKLDVCSTEQADAVVAAVEKKHGAIGAVIANAGIAWPDTPGEDVSDELWNRVIDVNLNGVFWCCREFGRAMVGRGNGTIVTVGSMSGVIANNPQRQVHYNAAKAGVHHMTKSLGAEWGEKGVRINCVAPTYVDTPMSNTSFDDPERMPIWMDFTPMRRVARPDEIASVILFLASDASSAMTGATVLVDCGYTCW